MKIVFNGKPADVAATTLEGVLAEMGLVDQRVAVERNRQLVPRRLWSQTPVAAGDAIEVVQLVGGGTPARAFTR